MPVRKTSMYLSMPAVRQSADQRHHRHAHQQHGNLHRRLTYGQAPLQLRNQIGQRHIDKAARRHHQKVRQPVVQLF